VRTDIALAAVPTGVAGTHAEPEERLVRRAQLGDAAAFEALYRTHVGRIHALCLRLAGSRPAAEDLTQEVFVRVYLAAPTLKRHASFVSWLYRIAGNICIDEHRRRKHERALVSSLDDPVRTESGEVSAEIPDDSRNPEKLVRRSELAGRVQEAIDSLPPKMRSVVLLFDMEGLSYDEIAQIVRCPVGTVKSRLFNARALLRERLAGYVAGASMGDE